MNTQSSSAALSSLLDPSGLIVYAHPSKLNETRTSAQNVSCSHPRCYTILHRPWHWADRGQSAAHATTHRLAQGPVHSRPGLGIRGINTSINCTDCPRSQGQLLSPLFANIAGAANSKARIQQAALGVPSGNRGAEKRTVVLWRDSQYCWEARAKWVTSLFTRKKGSACKKRILHCRLQGMPVVLGQRTILLAHRYSEEANTETREVLQRWSIFCPLNKMSYEIPVSDLIRNSQLFL